MKTLLYGCTDSEALLYVGPHKVIVNTLDLSAVTVDEDAEVIEFAVDWREPRPGDPVRTWTEIASNSLSRTLKDGEDVTVLSASAHASRAYTVPSKVTQTARAVPKDTRLTPTASLMRALLSSGRQVSLQNLAYMERFFDAHDAGSVLPATWNAWGGDAGRSWVRSTFTKVDTLTASVPEAVNLAAFSDSDDDAHTFFAERGENSVPEVVALYMMTPAGTFLAWADGDWVNCDSPSNDRLVQLDDETAIYVAGALFDAPESAVDLRTLEPHEWDMFADGYAGTDWNAVDLVMTAAGPTDGTPGQYTPQERSKNASGQLRDANGRFAKVGDTGAMQSGVGATIERVDQSTNNLLVKDANGNRYLVPAGSFKVGDPGTAQPPKPSGQPDPVTGTPGSQLPPLDLDEILAEPRVTKTTPKAWLKKLLQPMGAAQLKKVVTDYSDFIHNERQKRGKDFQPNGGFLDPSDPHPRQTERMEDHLRKSIHQHDRAAKRLYDEINHRHREAGVIAAGDPNNPNPEGAAVEMEARPDPDHSDVPPMHLAIVDKDDPRAVTDLVALVPANKTDTTPTLFRRVAGDWVEDVKLLGEMRSPTPPAVVKLSDADYNDVLQQVDNNNVSDADTSGPATPTAPSATPTTSPATAPQFSIDEDEDTVEFVAVWDNLGLPVHLVRAFTAAGEGGLDRNRGGAEKLRRYWLFGPGALKIRWNTPGDWTRCVRHLEKYLGPRAKGYCQLRHHEATGMWTGDKANRMGLSYSPGGEQLSTTDFIRCQDDIVMTAAARARRELAIAQVKGTMNTPDGPTALTRDDAEKAGGGKEFAIPLVIPEGVESGDGRTFDKGALTMRDLPLPLMWQFQTGDGHDGSVLVGRIDHVERTDKGLGNARGVFDTGPYGTEAQRLVENGMLRWVSADLDQFEAEQPQPKIAIVRAGEDKDEEGAELPKLGAEKMAISKGRLMGITLVPKPAFQEALIALAEIEEEISVDDGTYVGEPVVSEAEQIVASAGIAESIPVEPPSVWFERPLLNGPTPVTVTDEGQVYGHVATWDRDHIGLPRATRAPRSYSNYAYFHTGALRCSEGTDVHVGQLTLAGGHADMLADATTAVRHYDDTGSSIADVHVGEDSYGIWCAGALRPGTSPEQIRALRASAPSGDWRNINGRLELVAICQVNVPGFPVPRAQVASGSVCAIVAAGTAVLSRLRVQPMDELDLRLARLEEQEHRRAALRASAVIDRMAPAYLDAAVRRAELETIAAAARTRVYQILDVDGYLTEFKDFSPEKRKALAKDKKALPDGSFPIENSADLRRAVHAYGRASEDKKARVRRHIMRCARILGKSDMVPQDWSENALNDLALSKMDAQETITASLTDRANAIRERITLEVPDAGRD